MSTCVQCSKDHNGTEKVCEGCVKDAMTLMEGCLGGRPTPEQVYRMFDMGGCGVSPLEQFKPVARPVCMLLESIEQRYYNTLETLSK